MSANGADHSSLEPPPPRWKGSTKKFLRLPGGGPAAARESRGPPPTSGCAALGYFGVRAKTNNPNIGSELRCLWSCIEKLLVAHNFGAHLGTGENTRRSVPDHTTGLRLAAFTPLPEFQMFASGVADSPRFK